MTDSLTNLERVEERLARDCTASPVRYFNKGEFMTKQFGKIDETTGTAAWERFQDAMRRVVKVPSSEIKAKLAAENATRKRKRTRSAKIKAFREANPKS